MDHKSASPKKLRKAGREAIRTAEAGGAEFTGSEFTEDGPTASGPMGDEEEQHD